MMKSKEEDRLSNLPDSVLLHILSFFEANHAVQTCVISTRWVNLWKHVPTLRLCSTHNKSFKGSYSNLVSRILSLRDDSTTLHTLDFICDQNFVDPDTFVKSIRNIQQLRISIITSDILKFPPWLFSCRTLTSLDLFVHPDVMNIVFPNSLILPALTTLTLKYFYLSSGSGHDGCSTSEPFSGFKKLNTLIIQCCHVLNADTLSISSTTLVNLTLSGPVLDDYKLSTPSLCNFVLTGFPKNDILFESDISSVKHVYIDALIGPSCTAEKDSLLLLSWLLQFVNITSLTLSSSTLQVLSSVPDLFKVKLTSLCNLESLKIKMKVISPEAYIALGNSNSRSKQQGSKFELKQSTFIPDGVLDYLLQNTSSAQLHFI